ncbi:HAMP domain-containing sensor histidine kinase [Flavobacterium sp. MC2016-06]|uniref:sensor histidine kinase n=1 Tax=Flavobacterium sp. MC2016-06 TaxID=2676308 RepID=UPI0012BA778F|nr:HAMP domain-containing sensor histidine kinase [Flavobacterium sp. MC2016-06]MBU3859673.1 HAMP domain-containing histidine kinase [Flavobacterium sp. MC2016-06]
MKLASIEEKLKERIKELTCLYEISQIISQSNSVNNQVLQEIILSTKKAWHYNDEAIIEIQILDSNLSTSIINEQTVYQTSPITITKNNIGYIKVHYPRSRFTEDYFLADEQKLLDTIAHEIANFIEKHQILEKTTLLNQTIERMDRLNIFGQMTAGISHELNTTLGNILGFAELIKINNADPEIDSDISIIINAAIYSRDVVKKLMYFSTEIPQQLKLQPLQPIITFAVAFLKPNFLKKDIKSELIFEDNTLNSKIDSVQLTQVLLNLLLNAIYASPKKSIIRITIKNDTKNLFITIEDHGTGIPENIKQKIFDPFFTTKPINEGYGLGLSVVYSIIKSHNGEIFVKDNLPTGTIFIIKLPIQ